MIKQFQELRVESIHSLKGGTGTIQVIHFLEEREFSNKGRLFGISILKPGTSIGLHQHTGDFETYHILKGEGLFNDNGVQVKVKAGDTLYTKNGDSHSIENIGNEDLEYIALILFD